MHPHIRKIAMYSLPSDLTFAEGTDVTTAENPEASFAVAEDNLHGVFEQIPAMIWTTDLELGITFSAGNRRGRLTNSIHPYAGMTLGEFFGTDGQSTAIITAHLKALGGYAQSFEIAQDGAVFSGTVEPLFSAGGNLMGTVGVMTEVTEMCQAEEDRVRALAENHEADKRQTFADLANRFAYHFDDLFNSIAGYATIARLGLDVDHPMQRCLGEIENASQCAMDLIDQLRSPAEDPKPARSEAVDLTQLVRDQLRTFQVFLASGIKLQCDLGLEGANVAGDPELLRRLLVSLLFNAAAAIGADQGTISVRTQPASGPPAVLLDQEDGSRLPDGDYVWLQVSDTGPGLDQEARARVFQPFASAPGHGVGLGTARRIVEEHGGAITISSKPGLGTSYHVLLPVMQREESLPPESFF